MVYPEEIRKGQCTNLLEEKTKTSPSPVRRVHVRRAGFKNQNNLERTWLAKLPLSFEKKI